MERSQRTGEATWPTSSSRKRAPDSTREPSLFVQMGRVGSEVASRRRHRRARSGRRHVAGVEGSGDLQRDDARPGGARRPAGRGRRRRRRRRSGRRRCSWRPGARARRRSRRRRRRRRRGRRSSRWASPRRPRHRHGAGAHELHGVGVLRMPAAAAAVISPTEWPAMPPMRSRPAASRRARRGDQTGRDDERLGDGGVADGVGVRDGAVGGQVERRRPRSTPRGVRRSRAPRARARGNRGSASPVQGRRRRSPVQSANRWALCDVELHQGIRRSFVRGAHGGARISRADRDR